MDKEHFIDNSNRQINLSLGLKANYLARTKRWSRRIKQCANFASLLGLTERPFDLV